MACLNHSGTYAKQAAMHGSSWPAACIRITDVAHALNAHGGGPALQPTSCIGMRLPPKEGLCSARKGTQTNGDGHFSRTSVAWQRLGNTPHTPWRLTGRPRFRVCMTHSRPSRMHLKARWVKSHALSSLGWLPDLWNRAWELDRSAAEEGQLPARFLERLTCRTGFACHIVSSHRGRLYTRSLQVQQAAPPFVMHAALLMALNCHPAARKKLVFFAFGRMQGQPYGWIRRTQNLTGGANGSQSCRSERGY